MPIDVSLLLNIEQNRFTDSKLSLVENGLTDDDIIALVKAIKNNTHIQELDLSVNKITARGVKSLATLDFLIILNVSANNIGPEGAKFLAKSNLQKLDISANPIGNSAGEFSLSTHLVELIATECNITDVGAQRLFQSVYIRILDLSTNLIKGTSLEQIPSNVSLTELNLSQNGLSSDCLQYFAANKILVYLNLTNIFIDTTGITKLVENSSLEELILVQCLINDDGARELSKSCTLKRLELFNNRITDTGAKYLFENMTLLYLGLGSNPITSSLIEILRNSYVEYLGNAFTRTLEFIAQLSQKKSADTSSPGTSSEAVLLAASSPLFAPAYMRTEAQVIPPSPPEKQIEQIAISVARLQLPTEFVAFLHAANQQSFQIFQSKFRKYSEPPPGKKQKPEPSSV